METDLIVPPILTTPSPFTVIYIFCLALLIYVYQNKYLKTVQIHLSTTSEERLQFEEHRDKLITLKVDAEKYKGNSDHFATYSLIKRKINKLEVEYNKSPAVLRGGSCTTLVKYKSESVIYLALILSFVVFFSNILFAFYEHQDMPPTSCIDSIFYLLLWPLNNEVAESLYKFSDASLVDSLGNFCVSCFPSHYILVPSFFSFIIFYHMCCTTIEYVNSIIEKLTPIKKKGKSFF